MQHLVIRERTEQDVAASEWQKFLPAVALTGEEGNDALRRAEAVIRAQEERIRILEAMALTDELTGLANRRGFIGAFDRELALARRDADCGGILVMIDLDGFKGINDRFGHQAGDAYLRAVGQVLRDNVRLSDTVARLGGDEFAILFTRIDEANGVRRLAKLEKAFNAHSLSWESKSLPMRASFGSAVYAGTYGAEAIIQAADLRLYARKAHNRPRSGQMEPFHGSV
ncbi:MAG: GGDEF domain-containing protein [Alphaproteobacteria bacterium]|nr:GGDEF domain-containing protein [Alphaproteobacteria bacterium]